MMQTNKTIGMSNAPGSSRTVNLKHQQTTPIRSMRKSSRRDMGIDVHSSCSTPRSQRIEIVNSSFNSPSASFPPSQDSPDVVWDYTSPKLPKGSKKKEINITIEEFLKNLNQHQIPECNTQSAQYIKLLEKWMTHQNTTVVAKTTHKCVKEVNKKRSNKVIAEIKQFMESIQNKNQEVKLDSEERNNNVRESYQVPIDRANISTSSISVDKKSFIEGNSECDSSDELWGEIDNSFIVKATQVLEVCNSSYTNKNVEIMSTIPETISNTKVSKCFPLKEQNTQDSNEANCKNSLQNDKDLESQTKFILTQLINYDWDSGSDDEWENGFIIEDDLSQIPDEILSGNVTVQAESSHKSVSTEICKENEKVNSFEGDNVQWDDLSFEDELNKVSQKPKNIDFPRETEKVAVSEPSNDSGELFGNFDDESILCKPEVLSWIDEVESQVTQKNASEDVPRCTPEEIKKKKNEALRRRKNKQRGTKIGSFRK